MDTPFYEAKKVIEGMNAAVADRSDAEAVLIRLVEPFIFTEFGGRTEDEDFVEFVMEAYAAVPKVLNTFDATKGMRLESWGWRLMRNAVLRYMDKQHKMRSNETTMPDEIDADAPDVDPDTPAWHADTGWYHEPVGSGERAMRWKAEYELLKESLDSRDQIILESLLWGDNQTQIAEKLGVSQSRVSRLIRLMKEKVGD
jgi:RNA polymerase sigma factor (sigma-70 family)